VAAITLEIINLHVQLAIKRKEIKLLDDVIYIYQIYSKSTEYTYVGQTRYIQKRWSRHKNDLLGNKHHNIHLQRIFNKYGLDDLSFELINVVESDANIHEQIWIDTYKAIGKCINLSGDTNVHSKSLETRQKLSNSHKGKTVPIELRQQISDKLKGRIITEETREKMRAAYDKSKHGPLTEETKLKLSRSNGFIPIHIINNKGEKYVINNLRNFCVEHKLDRRSMQRVIKRIYKQHKGWRLESDTLS
jgi:group I intron endonuclease